MSITALIRNRFCFAPPRLDEIIAPFTGHEHMFKLLKLAEEYLPGEKDELVTLATIKAGERFVAKFSEAYFPIHLRNYYGSQPLENLLESIDDNHRAMNSDRYEPSYNRLPFGQILAEVLCQCPFPHQQRLTILDAFKSMQKLTPKKLLELIPEGGYTLSEIEYALTGELPVKYPGLLTRCRWLFGQTGNHWLDKNGEYKWSRKNVDNLKAAYPGSLELEKQMTDFDSWLGQGRDEKYAEIINWFYDRVPQRVRVRV
jgi:hypothetical protein